MTAQRPTLVLVPGAWHRPSTWDLLRGELDALGYASRTVKLPTTGPFPRGGLREDAEAVRAAIEAIGGPVVVVAHSYGGIPATEGLTDLPNVQQLVYLVAYVPDIDESLFSLHGAPDPDSTEDLFPIVSDPRAQLYADAPEAVGRPVRQPARRPAPPAVRRPCDPGRVAHRPVHLHHHRKRCRNPGPDSGADGPSREEHPSDPDQPLPVPVPSRRVGRGPRRDRQG
jgi:pimeloyl-ACP methyl ester carboxylesterase